jgi:hypothetical protein
LLLGGHAPVTGDLTQYDLDDPGAEPVVVPDTRVIRWAELPTVTVGAGLHLLGKVTPRPSPPSRP